MANLWYDKVLKKLKRKKGFKAFKHTKENGKKSPSTFHCRQREGNQGKKKQKQTLPFFSQ